MMLDGEGVRFAAEVSVRLWTIGLRLFFSVGLYRIVRG